MELTNYVRTRTENTVQSGPFKGMLLHDQISWGDGDVLSKLLGAYEAELHGVIEEAVTKPYKAVVNVGCAEGYYAIGLARRFEQATVFAFDLDEKARTSCRMAAAANRVGDRVDIRGACTPENLATLIQEQGRSLLVIDCEGYELTLLEPELVPGLADCDIIVECHDFIDPAITTTLQERLSATHLVSRIDEGERNPNQYPLLRGLNSLDRWIAMSEGRPKMMNWLICKSLRF
jgi:hypothetical protein